MTATKDECNLKMTVFKSCPRYFGALSVPLRCLFGALYMSSQSRQHINFNLSLCECLSAERLVPQKGEGAYGSRLLNYCVHFHLILSTLCNYLVETFEHRNVKRCRYGTLSTSKTMNAKEMTSLVNTSRIYLMKCSISCW